MSLTWANIRTINPRFLTRIDLRETANPLNPAPSSALSHLIPPHEIGTAPGFTEGVKAATWRPLGNPAVSDHRLMVGSQVLC